MKKVILSVAVSLFAASLAPAAFAGRHPAKQDEGMQRLRRRLKGDERKAHMKECLSANPPANKGTPAGKDEGLQQGGRRKGAEGRRSQEVHEHLPEGLTSRQLNRQKGPDGPFLLGRPIGPFSRGRRPPHPTCCRPPRSRSRYGLSRDSASSSRLTQRSGPLPRADRCRWCWSRPGRTPRYAVRCGRADATRGVGDDDVVARLAPEQEGWMGGVDHPALPRKLTRICWGRPASWRNLGRARRRASLGQGRGRERCRAGAAGLSIVGLAQHPAHRRRQDLGQLGRYGNGVGVAAFDQTDRHFLPRPDRRRLRIRGPHRRAAPA